MRENEVFDKIAAVKKNLESIIRGKDEVIELSIAALLSKGHLLIEDVPGVGKTTLAFALAKTIDATFRRIQFTSDLMPSDVIGVTVYNEVTRTFEFRHGPIFANIVLADEINRATPKTQSALLEAMNEKQVSVENFTYLLPEPFMLLATQNPVEYSGTFPLPESQLDRFAVSLRMGYPDEETEKSLVGLSPEALLPSRLTPVLSTTEVTLLQNEAEKVRLDETIVAYIVRLVRETRIRSDVRLGVSTRGAMSFCKVAKAIALINKRTYCIPDDVKKAAVPSLSHRIIPMGRETDPDMAASGSLIVKEILGSVPAP
ncbi:MAG: MoxR family ATPase [Thermodesulfobacteriota bacterium]